MIKSSVGTSSVADFLNIIGLFSDLEEQPQRRKVVFRWSDAGSDGAAEMGSAK
jgi:hypothetical protein